MNTPILILFFNRQENVLELIDALSKFRPPIIFLASDGGRTAIEHKKVCQIRIKVLQSISWDCEVHEKFNETNLGCKYAVHSAIQWFFGSVSQGIVLEDDCIPTEAFFIYAEKMLDIYKDINEVATISGRNEVAGFDKNKPIFCTKFFCWGWASWSHKIQNIDVETGYEKVSLLPLIVDTGYYEAQHLKGLQSLMLCGQVNSWAYSYDFAFRKQKKLHLIPPVNYITNIAIGSGTHISGQKKSDLPAIDQVVMPDNPELNPNSNPLYLSTYLKQKYSLLKLFFFPWIGRIFQLRKFFS